MVFIRHFIHLLLSAFVLTSYSLFAFSAVNLSPKDSLLSGYKKDLAGEVLVYHSCHPEAKTSLLIRCLNDQDYIEWETAPALVTKKNDTVEFCWIGGFSTGTSTANHVFHLYVNEDEKLSFSTIPHMPLKNWNIKGKDGYVLDFMFVSEDQVRDHFGYFFLKIPAKKVTAGKSLKIKIKGDGSGSRDWYMTMRYSLIPRLKVEPEEAVLKGENGQAKQRIKISLDHYSSDEAAVIKIDGQIQLNANLHFGVNNFIVPVEPVSQHKKSTVVVESQMHRVREIIDLAPVRSYEVFLLPHSHVDIGYTDVQPAIAQVHAANVLKAMRLIKATQQYPEASRFKWNVEMLWEAEAFLQSATDTNKNEFISLVRQGSIQLEGMYAGVMTGLCRDEELFHLFDYKFELEKRYKLTLNNAMITDIPGYSWGLIPVMAQCGIKYFSIGPNTGDRIGNTIKAWGDKPFWWKSPSGKEKVLCWMSSRGYSLFHAGSLAKSDGSQVLDYLAELSKSNYPYDLVQLRYTVGGDNGYPDTLLSDYVKDWNNKYVSPVLRIATTDEMFKAFENKYADKLPSFSGDFSPYWEDGAASTAKETAINRWSAEKLTQAQTLWAMNRPKSYPANTMYTAWNNVVLYSEHTWGAWNSISDPDLSNVRDQWEIKKGFAVTGDLLSSMLLDDAYVSGNEDNTISDEVRVFNTNSWNRSGLIYLPANKVIQRKSCLTDDKGRKYTGQLLSSGLICYHIENVGALQSQLLHFSKDDVPGIVEIRATPFKLENDFLVIKVDSLSGEIISMISKNTAKEWVDKTKGFGINSYGYSAQNARDNKGSGASLIKVLDKGPVLGTLQIVSQAPGCDKIIREISLVSGENKVRIKDHVFKKAVRKKENVRFAFPFNIISPQLKMDMAWFTLEPGKNQLPGSNMNYYTVQRWLDVSNDKEGVTIVSPDAPLWESGEMTAENWLQKDGNHWMEKPILSSTLFSWVMNNSWHTNFKADQEGEVIFNYVLCPHAVFEGENAYRLGVEETQTLISSTAADYLLHSELPSLVPDNEIVVTTVIPVAQEPDTYYYRFYNLSGTAKIYKPFDTKVEMIEVLPDGKNISGEFAELNMAPHEIKLVKVKKLMK